MGAVQEARVVGRYVLHGTIAAGGMATVHFGRLVGPVGFSRTVAIKRLHPHFASDPEFVSMFLDEARVAARIRHPNVVSTLDVVATSGELFLVMDYVPGESVSRLASTLRGRKQPFPLRIVSGIMVGALHGLHAAHEAKDERGAPLGIVHRDVSPQNIMVGTDGVARVLDFGVAKAAGRMQTTKAGQIKGKIAYMPPEQLRGGTVSRRTDVYAAGVMLWEMVTGQRLFASEHEAATLSKVLEGRVPSPLQSMKYRSPDPAEHAAAAALEPVILRALATDPEARFPTAREMADAIEGTCAPATPSEIGAWVEHVARDGLSSRAALVAEIESSSPGADRDSVAPDSSAPTRVDRREVSDAPSEPSGRSTGSRRTGHDEIVALLAQSEAPPAVRVATPSTQSSSYSATAQTRRRTPRRSAHRAAWSVLAALLLMSAIVGSAVLWQRLHAGRKADAAPRASADPPQPPSPPTASAIDAPTVQEPRPPPQPEATASAPRATPDADGSAGATSSPPKPIRAPKAIAPSTTGQAPPPPPPPKSDCSTPFWYDAQGVKHYKPDCVR